MAGKDQDDREDSAEDDAGLFRRTMADANVNRDHRNYRGGRHLPEETAPRPPVRIGKRDPLAAPSTSVGAGAGILIDDTGHGSTAMFARGGLQKNIIRKLKRGEYHIEQTLDLHGHTTAEAEPMLRNFLANALAHDSTTTLIIHGKGLRSGEAGGVLKPFTHDWLKHQAAVKAFCSALPRDGGTGAVYVLLRGRGR